MNGGRVCANNMVSTNPSTNHYDFQKIVSLVFSFLSFGCVVLNGLAWEDKREEEVENEKEELRLSHVTSALAAQE
mgnify:CR=1 FL=1